MVLGQSNAAGTFSGTITVTVIEVLANGNLLVSGEKQVGLNTENEFPALFGRGRPEPNRLWQYCQFHPSGGCAHRIPWQRQHRFSTDHGLVVQIFPDFLTLLNEYWDTP